MKLRQKLYGCNKHYLVVYTVSQKVYPLMFDNYCGKCGLIFKIILPGDSYENSLRT